MRKPPREQIECLGCNERGAWHQNGCITCLRPDPEVKGTVHATATGYWQYPAKFDMRSKSSLCANWVEREY